MLLHRSFMQNKAACSHVITQTEKAARTMLANRFNRKGTERNVILGSSECTVIRGTNGVRRAQSERHSFPKKCQIHATYAVWLHLQFG